MKNTALALTLAVSTLAAATASAATPAEMAAAHFDGIAGASVGHAMHGYAEDATLVWIGGPLDGAYHGRNEIRSVWMKFSGAQGAIDHTVTNLRTAANPKGATVTADVVFSGKKPIPVRYVLVYRDGALVSETWQIAAQKTGY